MRGKMMIAVFFMLVFFSFSTFCEAPPSKQKTKMEPLPPEAVRYLKALEAFNKTEGRRSMEPLYKSAYVAAGALTMGYGDKGLDYIERNVSDEIMLSELQKQVPGIEIDWWSESHSANPDMGYFLSLASKKGLDADIAFFSILKEQYDGNWANYIEATWDLGGCTKFGSLIPTDDYMKWSQYRKQYPQSYVEKSSEIMRDIEYEFTHNFNSCGDKDDVMREFRAFFKQVDDPDLETALLKRMAEIENGISDMSYNQSPGAVKKEPESLPAPAKEYIEALEAFRKADNSASLEPIYDLAWNAAEALMTSYSEKQPPYIMRVSDPVFASLKEKLPGLVLLRDSEDWRIDTDYEFFLKLALEKGTKADVEFFSLKVQQTKDGCPNYTDSGCTKYGSLILVDNYSKWLNYREQYPENYVRATDSELFWIELHFTGSMNLNACGGPKDVLKEFRAFLKVADDPAIKSAVKKRIREIEQGKSNAKFYCK